MMTQPVSPLSAALDYASMDLPVIPLRPDDLLPLIYWSRAASTHPGDITGWWDRWPDAGVAVASGRAFGLFTVDLDIKNGVDGIRAFEDLSQQFGPIPTTPVSRTPSGGLHYHFRLPAGDRVASSVKLYSGIDIRADGGMVRMPPTRRFDGRAYEWVVAPDQATFAEAPAWLIFLAQQKTAKRFSPRRFLPKAGPQRRAYILAAVEGEGSAVANSQPGERNNTLFKASARLAWFAVRGHASEGELIHVLLIAARDAGLLDEKNGERAVQRTIRQGFKAAELELQFDLEQETA